MLCQAYRRQLIGQRVDAPNYTSIRVAECMQFLYAGIGLVVRHARQQTTRIMASNGSAPWAKRSSKARNSDVERSWRKLSARPKTWPGSVETARAAWTAGTRRSGLAFWW